MSDIVSQLVQYIEAGDVANTEAVCNDNTISVTHLMLASRNFVDPAQLAKQITASPTNARRGIVVQAIMNAVKASEARLNQAQQPVQEISEPEAQVPDLPFEPDTPKPAPTTRSRRRAPAIDHNVGSLGDFSKPSRDAVEEAPKPAPASFNPEALDIVLDKLTRLSTVCDEIVNRQAALDEGVGKDFGRVLEAQQSIQEVAKELRLGLENVKGMVHSALIAVDKFRSGTEALEIALIGKGLLDSAPFADSWHKR